MSLFVQIAIAIIAAAAIFGVIWSVYGTVLTPVRCGADTGLITVVTASGGAEDLENTLAGLMWLQKNGVLEGTVIIADCGMDEEARELARLAMGKYGKISLCKAEDVEQWITRRSADPATG